MFWGRRSWICLYLCYRHAVSIECWTSLVSPLFSRRSSNSIYSNKHLSFSSDLLSLDSHISDFEIDYGGCRDDTAGNGGRRVFVTSLVAVLFTPLIASAQSGEHTDTLENIKIGAGRWKPLTDTEPSDASLLQPSYPPTFCTYAARFLIRYDENVRSWWSQLEESVQSLDPLKSRDILDRAFGSFAKSLELAFRGTASTTLYDLFEHAYGSQSDNESQRQIALLFALLPESQQPSSRLKSYCNFAAAPVTDSDCQLPKEDADLAADVKLLLPAIYDVRVKKAPKSDEKVSFVVNPSLSISEVGMVSDGGPTTVSTIFGQFASNPLMRELPKYSFRTYSLLGLAGALGCALTHSFVIPLDVIKTRAQTDPDKGIVKSSASIVAAEGIEGLFLGAQATIVGYFWYGLSIYPAYALFKRYLSNQLLSYEYAITHGNEIALFAGASAAVVASFGLAPIEAARIRVVADPGVYKPLGLTGTLRVIASEDSRLGWTNLYTSLPSLLVRQVIFGSVKFLAFERACEYIFNSLPELRDATWTCLAVSLVAGGWSGVVSAVFSQPADSVLTYIAKDNQNDTRGTNILMQVQHMVAEGGMAALFRGLGSRCLWSGCIIAGQFLLYDVFRTMFGVDADNLKQIFEFSLPADVNIISL